MLEQEGLYRDSSSFLARSEIYGRWFFCRQKLLVAWFHHCKERRAPSFRFLESEQVDAAPGQGSKGSPLWWATVCLRRGASNGRSAQLFSAFQQPREMNTFPTEEELCWSGVAAERKTCSYVLQQDGSACISDLLYTTWAYHLAEQVLLLSTEQGGFVRFTFLQVKAFPFIRSFVAAAVRWCTLPTCLPPLMLSPTEGNSERGLNLCTHRAGHHAGRSRGVRSMSSCSSGSLLCQCCRSDRLLQRLQPSLVLRSGKDADCSKLFSSFPSEPPLFSLWFRCHPLFFIQGTTKRIFYKEYVTID